MAARAAAPDGGALPAGDTREGVTFSMSQTDLIGTTATCSIGDGTGATVAGIGIDVTANQPHHGGPTHRSARGIR